MYEYQVFLHLPGDTLYHLTTAIMPDALGALLSALVSAGQPQFSEIVVRIVPKG